MEQKRPQGPPDLRESQFNTLNRLSAIISQSDHLEKAFGDVLDQLLDLTGADIGSVHILETNKAQLKLIATRGVSKDFIYAEQCIPTGECLCGKAAQTGELVFSPDLSQEPRLTRAACRDEQFGSLVSIPLKSRDRVVGLLTIYAKHPHCFSEMDHGLLVLVSHQMGVAIENAQLYARTRELAVLEERALIAQEIHDGIAQSLAYLNFETKRLEELLKTRNRKQALSELDRIREVIKDTYEDVRELLVDFRTKIKKDEDLYKVLDRYIKDFSQRTAIRAHFVSTVGGSDSSASGRLALSPAVQVQVFRIIQEALSNVRKHASAKEVTVALSATSTYLEIKVQDDGLGFDPQPISGEQNLHLGLAIMKERVAKLQGSFELDSRPGSGTTLRIIIPLKPKEG